MGLNIRKAESPRDIAYCTQIRTIVFVIEQNVPVNREVDEYEGESEYLLVLIDDKPVGTIRWRVIDNNAAKIERMAVLNEFRKNGIGQKLMNEVIEDITKNQNISAIQLGSQDTAIEYYQKFGFSIQGDGYIDGGNIPHHDMVLEIKR